MVRITFNKKYIFAGLLQKPQAGGDSGKARGQPVPGERGPHPALGHQRDRGAWGVFCLIWVFSPKIICLSLIRQVGSVTEM